MLREWNYPEKTTRTHRVKAQEQKYMIKSTFSSLLLHLRPTITVFRTLWLQPDSSAAFRLLPLNTLMETDIELLSVASVEWKHGSGNTLRACWCIKFFTFNRFIDRNYFLKTPLLASRSYLTLISQWKHYRVLLTSAGFVSLRALLFAGLNSMHGRCFKLQSSCECSLAVLERKPFKCAAGCVKTCIS